MKRNNKTNQNVTMTLQRFSLFLAVMLAFVAIGAGIGVYRARAIAEAAEETAEEAVETTTYDAIYSTSNPVPEIAANVRPSVVQVITSTAAWNPQTRQVSTQETGYGSGTYIRKLDEGEGGYILTNNHVIENAEQVEILWLDGTRMKAEVVGADDGTDVAVLRFDESAPEDATPVPMGDSDALQVGELAIVIGNPGAGDSVLFGTVTAGIVSGLGRDTINAHNFSRTVSVIQVDAAINAGNSGGALLNAKGEIVGIPTLKMMYSYSSIYEGLGFCIPINTAKDIAEQLIETGKVVRPRIGIGVQDFDGPDEAIPTWPPMGIQVTMVEEDSPAEEAGLQRGDVITEVDGVRVKIYTEPTTEIDKHQAGDTITLKVYRYYDEDGRVLNQYQELDVDVTLEILD